MDVGGLHDLKPMNFDELLKNVISVEEAVQLVNNSNNKPSSASSSSSSSSPPPPNCFINGALRADQGEIGTNKESSETTLEEFLMRAGVINLGNQKSRQGLMSFDPMEDQWMHFQMAAANQQMNEITTTSGDNMAYLDQIQNSPMASISMPMQRKVVGDPKWRSSVDMTEKTIERRQKRMIKNRESAARSRARKQVLIVHLSTHIISQLV